MKPKEPQLYEIWEEEKPSIPELSWRMQLLEYIAQYPTQDAAVKHRDRIEFEIRMKLAIEQQKSK